MCTPTITEPCGNLHSRVDIEASNCVTEPPSRACVTWTQKDTSARRAILRLLDSIKELASPERWRRLDAKRRKC